MWGSKLGVPHFRELPYGFFGFPDPSPKVWNSYALLVFGVGKEQNTLSSTVRGLKLLALSWRGASGAKRKALEDILGPKQKQTPKTQGLEALFANPKLYTQAKILKPKLLEP